MVPLMLSVCVNVIRRLMALSWRMWLCGLGRFYPLISAHFQFSHKIDRHLTPSVRAPWEEGRRTLRVPVFPLNSLLALDTVLSTQTFLHKSGRSNPRL